MTRVRRIVAVLAAVAAAAIGVAVGPSASAEPFANGRNPVILVHGFSGKAANWDTVKQALIAGGYSADQIVAITYDTFYQSNVRSAELLGAKVNEVLSRTGASKVDIVSHSMGSLNSRYCVKFAGCAGKTERWISLAGANLGTGVANYCSFFVTCREMVPGSAVLTKLNAAPAVPAGTKWTTLWSPGDRIIVPATNTVIPGANNVQVNSSISHLGILQDAGVIAQVQRLLGA